MRNIVIVDGVRTGFGKIGGSLSRFTMAELSGKAIDALLDKTKLLEKGAKVEGVYIGSALGDCKTLAQARYSVLCSRLGYYVWSSTVERQCGSAIDAINHAAAAIAFGQADIMIAGGAESYSTFFCKFPMNNVVPNKMVMPMPYKQCHAPDPEDCIDMIETAENVAKKYHITREECDAFALRSQMRAKAAHEKGYFDEEIFPVTLPATRKTPEIQFADDEFMRPTTTMEGLAALPSVKPGGVTTAGNASGRNDGAGMVLLMTEEKAKELGYEPYARIVMGGNAGVDPKFMGLGPVYSSLDAIRRAGLKVDDIDLWECNEAFAAQNIGVIRGLEEESGCKINEDNWNPNGGAISYGHPNGASGARVCMFTMRELERRGGKYGIFTSCCGGGLGVSTLIENLRR